MYLDTRYNNNNTYLDGMTIGHTVQEYCIYVYGMAIGHTVQCTLYICRWYIYVLNTLYNVD